MRLFDPEHWGLWSSPTMLLFGVVDDPTQARELLGDRIYAVAALVVVLSFLAGRQLLQSATRRIWPEASRQARQRGAGA